MELAFNPGDLVKVGDNADTDFLATRGATGKVIAINGTGTPEGFDGLYDQPYCVEFPTEIDCEVGYDDGTEKGTTVTASMKCVWYNPEDLTIITTANPEKTEVLHKTPETAEAIPSEN